MAQDSREPGSQEQMALWLFLDCKFSPVFLGVKLETMTLQGLQTVGQMCVEEIHFYHTIVWLNITLTTHANTLYTPTHPHTMVSHTLYTPAHTLYYSISYTMHVSTTTYTTLYILSICHTLYTSTHTPVPTHLHPRTPISTHVSMHIHRWTYACLLYTSDAADE